MKTLTSYSRWIIIVSALLMVSAYFVPLWQILMWAPQYPEGLVMKIWTNTLSGDVKIISALNHYIGMKHIEVSMFPEFTYMIYIVGFIISIGILAAIINKRFMLLLYTTLILSAGIGALVDFYLWGYDYGHNLSPTAPIVVPGMSYQPPLIGTKQLLNFTAFSGPDIGGWIFICAGALAVGTSLFELYRSKKEMKHKNNVVNMKYEKNLMKILFATFILGIVSISCSVKPEPLVIGKDDCYSCKMTVVDNKFGAEIVTKKGKIYKFDDMNCMLNFLRSGYEQNENISSYLVVDYGNPTKLLNATQAVYIESELVKSPMNGNVAAFYSSEELRKFNTEWKGKILTWNDLSTQFK